MPGLWRSLIKWLSDPPIAYWIDHKLKRNTFELRGELIVRGRGASKTDLIRVADIVSWTDFGDPWIYVVPMRLRDGRTVEWVDPYMELEGILRQAAPERMIIGYNLPPGGTAGLAWPCPHMAHSAWNVRSSASRSPNTFHLSGRQIQRRTMQRRARRSSSSLLEREVSRLSPV